MSTDAQYAFEVSLFTLAISRYEIVKETTHIYVTKYHGTRKKRTSMDVWFKTLDEAAAFVAEEGKSQVAQLQKSIRRLESRMHAASCKEAYDADLYKRDFVPGGPIEL